WRPHKLWTRFCGRMAYGRQCRRPHSERRKAGRSAGAAIDKGRTIDQPQDRQSPRPHHPGNPAGHRRRGDPMMRRREFIAALGGAAAWPLAARAQQADRVRRIGVLMGPAENDPEGKTRLSAFTRALADLGWTDGHNLRMDLRWGGGDTNRIRAF